jgi:hypothetical protein
MRPFNESGLLQNPAQACALPLFLPRSPIESIRRPWRDISFQRWCEGHNSIIFAASHKQKLCFLAKASGLIFGQGQKGQRSASQNFNGKAI